MTVLKNDEVFKVAGDRVVSVTVTFGVNEKVSDATLLLNAAEAIKFYADNRKHKSWARQIEIKRK
jgi:ribosomal protein L5